MISGVIKYSAVTAKVRAMYGKSLSGVQWERLMEAESVRAVWEILRKSEAWAIAGENPRCAEDGQLFIRTLSEQLERDCKNLSHYLDKKDGERLSAFLRHQEGPQAMTPEQYQLWWSADGKKLSVSKGVAGAEADALNLVYILRLRRFPGSRDKAKELLIPLRSDLTPQLVDRLLQAKDDGAVLDILRKTRWGGVFQSLAPGDLEKQYQAYMEEFCRHIIATAQPGMAVVQAFLPLKDMDRQKLTRLIGAVTRGIDPKLVV